jgi:membrane protease subunit HflC
MRWTLIAAGVVVGSLLLLWNFVFFTVDQTQQALVVEFGSPKRVVTEPGLNMYLPWQNVIKFEKRVLDLDAQPEEVTSSDQKRLVVDAFARYRIVDPLKFYQTVNNTDNANLRLSAILNSNLRVTLAGRSFQAVLSAQRAELMRLIREETNEEAKALGIEIVDVRIRRADLPQANSEAIFKRMRRTGHAKPPTSAPRATRRRRKSGPTPTVRRRLSSPRRPRPPTSCEARAKASATASLPRPSRAIRASSSSTARCRPMARRCRTPTRPWCSRRTASSSSTSTLARDEPRRHSSRNALRPIVIIFRCSHRADCA